MKMIHTVCLGEMSVKTRTVVSQPEDASWPDDFAAALPYCPKCGTYPLPEAVKKEVTR